MRAILILLVCAAPALAQPTDADRQRAKALFDEGSSEYRAAHYDRAIELFSEAYKLSHAPGLLFNIAQAYRLKGTAFCAQALDYYKRSLDEDLAAGNRGEMEERVREMEACAKPAVAVAPPVDPPKPPPVVIQPVEPRVVEREQPLPAQRRLAPLVTIGAGAAVALTGGVIYWRARVKFDDVKASCPCAPGAFSGWETATTASYVMLGAGSLAMAGGLIWWWLAPAHASHVAPAPGGIQYTTRF